MKATYIPFNDQAGRQITDGTKRSEILAAAIGRAVANVMPLPTSQVDSPAGFFNVTCLPQVRELVSEWNENVVFNAKCATDYARAFWMLRYVAAHPNARPLYNGAYGFFDTIGCVSTYFSEDQHAFLNENKETILALSTSASFLISAMECVNA
jgi:hypothetical protein